MPNFSKGSHTAQPERFCKYIHRYCNQTRLDGYDYCIRHILEDKTAPFKQCMYVNQPNKKRCTNAAPKTDKIEKRESTLCPFHAKRALMKIKPFHPKKKPTVEGPTALLRYLEHYCSDPVHDPVYNRDVGLNEKYEIATSEGGRPSNLEQVEASFVDGESIEKKAHIESVDDDFCWVEKTGDYLEHAGVYTHKEVVTIAREKILRLQQLYCDELKVLYRELKEARRRFLTKVEKPGPNPDLSLEPQKPLKFVYRDLKEVRGRLLAKIEKPSASGSAEADLQRTSEVNVKLLESLSRYHRCNGVERILRQRAQEKRAGIPKPATILCTFENNDIKCSLPALVLTKFCKNHILSDPKQVMFVPCGLGRNCKKPVLPLEEKVACDQHFNLSFSRPKVDDIAPIPSTSDLLLEPELFHSMDDIAALGLDVITPGSLFGLDQFGEPGESTDTVHSVDQTDLMQIHAITLNPPSDIFSDSRKSESE